VSSTLFGWSEDTLSSCFACIYLANQANTDAITQEMLDWHLLTLVRKSTSSDTPNWYQAMNGLYANGYWDAMVKELETGTDIEVARELWMKSCKRVMD